jgi:hypothetical protein
LPGLEVRINVNNMKMIMFHMGGRLSKNENGVWEQRKCRLYIKLNI